MKMLDTNILTAVLRKNPMAVAALDHYRAREQIAISAVSHGEVLFGLAKRPEATQLRKAALFLLDTLDILPWDASVSPIYGDLRAKLESKGTPLGSMDMLIAAHALTLGATLITADKAFLMVDGLTVENWA